MREREIYRDFGKKIADFRNSHNLTQAQLARQIGLSRASLANIERGEQRVYLHQLLALSAALAPVPFEELLPSMDRAAAKADVTLSGDKLSRAQERAVKELVSSITKTSRSAGR